ncbi:hypothetical protein MMC30_008108 [Trapelia coarctata]|nr:hypothetical protein [Trapelia coarctata]
MSTFFDPTRNFSFYAVPAAWVLCLLPHAYATSLYDRSSSQKFDTRNPRALKEKLASDQTLSQATKDRIMRAEGAQQNGFENIGLFAAAVVAGNVAGVDNWWLNTLSGAYVASRVLYNVVYINNETEGMAKVRTGVFLGGVFVIFQLFTMAGNRMKNTMVSK